MSIVALHFVQWVIAHGWALTTSLHHANGRYWLEWNGDPHHHEIYSSCVRHAARTSTTASDRYWLSRMLRDPRYGC